MYKGFRLLGECVLHVAVAQDTIYRPRAVDLLGDPTVVVARALVYIPGS